MLCIFLLVYGERNDGFGLVNIYTVNLTMFFTNLALHFGCLATIRNGIQMAKHVIFHKEEFDNPYGAFALGILIVLANMLCATTNMLHSLQ